MQLVEKGKLDLSAPISSYLPDLPKNWQKVTLKQLLSHTSGLPDIMNKHFQHIDSVGEEESWFALKQRALYFEPGTAFRYNQTNVSRVSSFEKTYSIITHTSPETTKGSEQIAGQAVAFNQIL